MALWVEKHHGDDGHTVIHLNIGRDPPDHGMVLLTDRAGMRVGSIAAGGRGERAGVKPGMVITRINGIALTGVSEAIAAQIVTNLSLGQTVTYEMTDGSHITAGAAMTLVLLDEGQGARIAERVPSGSAGREFVLRDLIHDHPQAMRVHAIDAWLGRVFTVAKEFYVPSVGYIDVLLADERGRLIVVECKLWSNPQARREVVGQILDYARELARWDYEDLQRQISATTKRAGNVLYEMACEAGCELDEARFVDGVARDLAAGRFLLIVAGDGITEGARRIGEYLQDQPGLAFGFGLVEIAEYRATDASGTERTIMQPRLLARTATIERHVIRSEVPGVVIDAIEQRSAAGEGTRTSISEIALAWRAFAQRFASEVRFDDPGQPMPRSGGQGWIKVPLPGAYYINLYRSQGEGQIGAQVRFPGAEGEEDFASLLSERKAIDSELALAGIEPPQWYEGEERRIIMRHASPLPWGEESEAAQREWFARAANALVNSLRPRLRRQADEAV